MKVSNSSDKAGLPPGSLIYVGNKNPVHNIEIELIEYDRYDINSEIIQNITTCFKKVNEEKISWININGVHDLDLIQKVGEGLKIHNLTIEDILNTNQRPKAEFAENYIYTTLKMINYSVEKETFEKEQISILLTKNLVLTIQEYPGDVFNGVRDRIKSNKGRIRKLGADYLLYSLLDSIIDGYFKVIEQLDEEVERIEDRLELDQAIIHDVHWLKKELLYIRRATSPVRDIISFLMREESYLITEQCSVYLKDAYDHCIQVHEAVELTRDIVSGLIEIHLTSVNNRMNEIMKYLTVFASIFIPLTFVTGIYGMNFEYMPELHWKYSYFVLLALLFLTGTGLYFLFKKKKWV